MARVGAVRGLALARAGRETVGERMGVLEKGREREGMRGRYGEGRERTKHQATVGPYTGVLKSSVSGTKFLVPKVNLAPQDWLLAIYC